MIARPQTPITYVKPFTSGAVFTTEECIEGKNLTAGSSQVRAGCAASCLTRIS